MKTILVTGGAGFIGSNLYDTLLEQGERVICLDNFSTGHRYNIESMLSNPNFTLIEGDIRDLATCQKAMKGVSYILYEAALGSVSHSINDPINTSQVNIDGFTHMLVAAREAGMKRFIYAVSSSTYGDSPSLPKVEDAIGRPSSPYTVAKYVNELYADVFAKTYGMECIALRYFNVFERRQDPNGAYATVTPLFVKQLMNHQSPVINGDGNYSRDFTYTDNVIQMNLLALNTNNPQAINQVYNTAFGERTTLKQLVNYQKECMSYFDPTIANIEVQYDLSRAGDISHSLASIDKETTIWLSAIILYTEWFKKGDKMILEQHKIEMKRHQMNYKIAVIGLEHVGLPLTRLFSTKHPTIEFDINRSRIDQLMKEIDAKLEVSNALLQEAIEENGFICSCNLDDIKDCNVYIVTVPTSVDKQNTPDLLPLIKASETVGKVIAKDDIVVYESTFYPGATEEDSIPVVERISGLIFNQDFFYSYSPERINLGDKVNILTKIKKITSGSTSTIADEVDTLYNTILENSTHKVPNMNMTKAAKAIENAQRDLNITKRPYNVA